jgi:hypothetical protein
VVRAQGLTVEQPRGGRVGLVSAKPSRRSTGRVSVASSRSLIKVSTKALVIHSKRSRRSGTSVLGRWSRAERASRVTSEFENGVHSGRPAIMTGRRSLDDQGFRPERRWSDGARSLCGCNAVSIRGGNTPMDLDRRSNRVLSAARLRACGQVLSIRLRQHRAEHRRAMQHWGSLQGRIRTRCRAASVCDEVPLRRQRRWEGWSR